MPVGIKKGIGRLQTDLFSRVTKLVVLGVGFELALF